MTTRQTILGLDIGTTSTKAVLFDLSGAELATAQRPYGIQMPRAGWVEQQPEDLWEAVVGTIREVVGRGGAKTHALAMALAAQSGSLIPAKAGGAPVYPAIIWMDGRTEDLVKKWQTEGVEKRVRQASGWSLSPGLGLPTIAWLRQFQPDVFAAAERYLSVNDFLVHRLTGQFCMNPSNGSGMQLVDVTAGQWNDELCALAGIKADQLSPIQLSGAVIGKITAEAGRLTGLPEETLVINGGHDQSCTALGVGVTAPGEALLACGTAWVVTTVVDKPAVETVPADVNVGFHDVPQRWTAGQSLGGLGASLEWLVNRCWQGAEPNSPPSRAEMYTALNNELAEAAPDHNDFFFVPLAGGHHAPAGMQQGGFVGLRLDHSRADMARAVMEGAAFELRWALDHIRQAGMPIKRLWMVGGAAQSPIWPNIIANVTGVPLALPQYKHWPALGAAILAGVGAGVFETIEAGQARFQKPAQYITPDRELMALYDERFTTYQQIIRHYRTLF
jgi:xylulokinase